MITNYKNQVRVSSTEAADSCNAVSPEIVFFCWKRFQGSQCPGNSMRLGHLPLSPSIRSQGGWETTKQLFGFDFGWDVEISTVYLKPPSHIEHLGRGTFFIPSISSPKFIYYRTEGNAKTIINGLIFALCTALWWVYMHYLFLIVLCFERSFRTLAMPHFKKPMTWCLNAHKPNACTDLLFPDNHYRAWDFSMQIF